MVEILEAESFSPASCTLLPCASAKHHISYGPLPDRLGQLLLLDLWEYRRQVEIKKGRIEGLRIGTCESRLQVPNPVCPCACLL